MSALREGTTDERPTLSQPRLPIASRREWSLHRAYQLSLGRALMRALVTAVVVAALAGGIAVAAAQTARELPPLDSPEWTALWQSESPSAWAVIAWVTVLLLVACALTVRAGLRSGVVTVRALGFHCRRGWRSGSDKLADGVRKAHQDHDGDVDRSDAIIWGIVATVLLVAVPVAAVFVAVDEDMFAVAQQAAQPSQPAYVAYLFAGIVACAVLIATIAVLAGLVDFTAVGYLIGVVFPRFQPSISGGPTSPPCLVCAGQRRERPLLLRLRRPLVAWARRGVEAGAARNAWLAYLRTNSDLTIVLLVALLISTGAALVTSTLMAATTWVTLLISLAVLYWALRGTSDSLLDALLFEPNWRRIARMLGAMLAVAVLVGNAAVLVRADELLQRAATSAGLGDEPNAAMLFLLACEGCGLYVLRAWIFARHAWTTRWTAAEAARGSLLPLIGLALAAVLASWLPFLVLNVATWLAACSAPWRHEWLQTHRQQATDTPDPQRLARTPPVLRHPLLTSQCGRDSAP